MKKTKNKIIISILLVVLIAGIIVTAVKGLNYDILYSNAKRIDLDIGKQFEEKDIKEITKETINNQAIIQKMELFEESVAITAKEITEEQKENIINKINEKYETEINAENVEIKTIANVKGRDIIKKYITPFCIASAIIIVYLIIRYRKLGVSKVLLKTIGIIVLAQLELLSVMAITRIPVGRLTISLVLTVYLITLIGITTKFETELQKVKKEEVNKK